MSRHTKQQYEDVAKVLKENRDWALQLGNSHARAVMASTIGTFADLFAADNPPVCTFHGEHDGIWGADCRREGGFNREQFLAACGLEPMPTAGKGTDLHSPHQEVKGDS